MLAVCGQFYIICIQKYTRKCNALSMRLKRAFSPNDLCQCKLNLIGIRSFTFEGYVAKHYCHISYIEQYMLYSNSPPPTHTHIYRVRVDWPFYGEMR